MKVRELQERRRLLARVLLVGEQDVDALQKRLAATLGWGDDRARGRRLRPLARRYAVWVENRVRPTFSEALAFLEGDRGLPRLLKAESTEFSLAALLAEEQRMQPAPVARAWGVPSIRSVRDLAEWLYMSPDELEWFADLEGRQSGAAGLGKLGHYHYRVLTKADGRVRLIEAPKERLKEAQRRILREILGKVPVHDAAHGFCEGRSIRSFAEPHVGQPMVLRMDLREFFPSIERARVCAVFRTMGYPEGVAARLGGVCTTRTPRGVWKGVGGGELGEMAAVYARAHLAQGAPTSPALANLCAYRLDCRLSGLASSMGARYTRYADDLAFSGHALMGQREWMEVRVAAIALEEGFHVNLRKTRWMGRGVQQRLTGLVVNERVNVSRAAVDALKATLTNCVRFGPEGQNREGVADFRMHLLGRVGFVASVALERGRRLAGIFEAIRWE
jgi:retron-type reverse transcriptase